MNKFLIAEEEKKRILSLHKQHMNEATDEEILRKAIQVGCLTGGSLKRRKSTGQLFYRKPSAKDANKMVDFFADMTFTFEDGSKKGKWKCDKLIDAPPPAPVQGGDPDYEIKKAKDDGWKTYEELKADNVDPSTIDIQFNKKVIGKTTLYKSKYSDVQVNTDLGTAELNQQQKAWVDKLSKNGYKFNVPLAQRETMTAYKPEQLGVPAGLFKSEAMFYFDPTSVASKTKKGESSIEADLKSQTPEKSACRDYIKDYFEVWRTRTKLPGSRNEDTKQMVAKCARTYKGRWGMFGGDKLDNMIDVLTGSKEGGPPNYGPGSEYRVQLD